MLHFGAYQLDMVTGELRKRGFRIKLQPMPKRVLVALAAKHGDVVSRKLLFRRMWPDGPSTDAEHGLNTAVKKLRAALNDNPLQPRYIQTVPGAGYRFIAEMNVNGVPPPAVPIAKVLARRVAAAAQSD